jgi:hypothetical protein
MKPTLSTALAALLALHGATVLAHDDAKGRDKGVEQGRQDDHAALLGKPGEPAKVSRTINVKTSDAMRFTPGRIK